LVTDYLEVGLGGTCVLQIGLDNTCYLCARGRPQQGFELCLACEDPFNCFTDLSALLQSAV